MKSLANPVILTQLANYSQIYNAFNVGFRNHNDTVRGWVGGDMGNTLWIDGDSIKTTHTDPTAVQGVFLYGPKPDINSYPYQNRVGILPWSTTKWSMYN
jgi:hypothetical protein